MEPVPSEGVLRLSPEQEQAIVRIASRILVMNTTKSRLAVTADDFMGSAGWITHGCFVTVKRNGKLRSCCGTFGTKAQLAMSLEQAARRTVADDPRFPPLVVRELPKLSISVSILFSPRRCEAQGADRAAEVVVGKHGLVARRGTSSGLLLPSVAEEHGLDAEAFLRHVCVKAGLPPHSWKDDDVEIQLFEGQSAEGNFVWPNDFDETASPPPFTASDAARLAHWAQSNLMAMLEGRAPSSFDFQLVDGNIPGLALTICDTRFETWPSSVRFAPREGLPLQTTLFSMTEQVAGEVAKWVAQNANAQGEVVIQRPFEIRLGLLTEFAFLGPTQSPDILNENPKEQAFIVIRGPYAGCAWAPSGTAESQWNAVLAALGGPNTSSGSVFSANIASNATSLIAADGPQPLNDRRPRDSAQAGRFYSSNPKELWTTVDNLLKPNEEPKSSWQVVIAPHAGLAYSGKVAAEALRQLAIPDRIVIIGPKHTREGSAWAISPCAAWQLPGEVRLKNDLEFAEALAHRVRGLELDAAAHLHEHSIEVELPFFARLAPTAHYVGIVLGDGDYRSCCELGEQLAHVIRESETPTLLVVSTDMNHFADDRTTRRLDSMAIDCLERQDSRRLFDTCHKEQISMCGMLPAVVALEAMKSLGKRGESKRVAYATSADTNGDTSRVVGYASMLLR